jgi:hypothetical protein
VQKNWIGNIPNANLKDYQRGRLYSAEEACLWGELEILSPKQVEDIIYKISQWAEINPPKLILEGNSIAYATADTICLPIPITITRTMLFVAHEMSHVINYKGKNADHHGKYFAGTYLDVVKEFVAENTYYNLKKTFDFYKVKYFK